jgi:ribosome-associated heat shock protein Hsp15
MKLSFFHHFIKPRFYLPRMHQDDSNDRTRIDKWLWAARFFKTRSLATEAVDGGKVQINGETAKPAKQVKIGDTVRLRQGALEYRLLVRGIAERRGPASVAQALYEEEPESKAAREKHAEQLRMAPAAFVYEEKGRPTKKDRRDLSRFIDERRRNR